MTTDTPPILRDLVTQRITARWSDFTARHPNLADAIDRGELIERGAQQLLDEPAVREALAAAGLDEAKLAAVATLLDYADWWASRALPGG